jgi:rhamnosyltransferase
MDAGYSHVLLLDQDSALPADMVRKLLNAETKLIQQGSEVAAVGPGFADEKTGAMSCAIRNGLLHVTRIQIQPSSKDPVESDNLIASGCLIRASVLKQVGLMSDKLFIDWVDVEWCHRARSKGFHSYIIPNIVMTHSIGDSAVRVFGKEINLHSDIRDFYIVRNATYLLRERRMGWRWRLVTMINVPKHILVHSWFSQGRLKTLKLLSAAVLDGLFGNMKRFN